MLFQALVGYRLMEKLVLRLLLVKGGAVEKRDASVMHFKKIFVLGTQGCQLPHPIDNACNIWWEII